MLNVVHTHTYIMQAARRRIIVVVVDVVAGAQGLMNTQSAALFLPIRCGY